MSSQRPPGSTDKTKRFRLSWWWWLSSLCSINTILLGLSCKDRNRLKPQSCRSSGRWEPELSPTLITHSPPFQLTPVLQVNPKGNQAWIFIRRADAEAEAPTLWPSDVKNWLIRKDADAGKDWRQEEKRMTEDWMVGWHHWLNRQEFEQAPGVGDGQGSLLCLQSMGLQSQTWLSNWIELNLPGSTVCHVPERRQLEHGIRVSCSSAWPEANSGQF